MIDESDHDHDNNDYNDAGDAIIDPPDDCSHNHDKFSPELDSRVPGPSHFPVAAAPKMRKPPWKHSMKVEKKQQATSKANESKSNVWKNVKADFQNSNNRVTFKEFFWG